jgi:D-serine dehydratase
MSEFCRNRGVSLAPHGKTYMSPDIVRRQLDAGAWGVTAASAGQVRALSAWGVGRILVANEVIDPAGLGWMAAHLADCPELDLYCLVDSPAAVNIMAEALETASPGRPLKVLVELGFRGGRSGCRTRDGALEVARAAAASDALELAGVEGYEGIISSGSRPDTERDVRAFMHEVRALACDLDDARLFEHLDEVVVSAGGSAYFDIAVEVLGAPWKLGRPVRVVLRGGCYATHDSGMYKRLSPFDGRARDADRLIHALELWATITSRPEEGLAIANFGKRDASHDIEMPVPLGVRRRAGGALAPAGGMRVTALNDHHASVEISESCDIAVGDMLCCGISHPCTTFDKWRLIAMVDDDYTITGAVQTFF